MCFVNDDCDWIASVWEESTRIADKPTRCDECHRTISVGQTVHDIHQEECDYCKACEDGDCDCDERGEDCCACEEPTQGETYDHEMCADCHRFLQAVKAAEIEVGCRESESQPPLGQMLECLQESGARESLKYFKTAVVMFPELKASGYLAFLWQKVI